MNQGRWVLLIASEVGNTDSVADRAMERLVSAINEEGYRVVRTVTPDDGLSLVKSDPSHSAILLDWDLEDDNQFDERAALRIIREVRYRNKKLPIFLIADRTLVSELPLEVVKQVHEYIHLFGDTPAFIANRVDFAVERYHEQLLPPYFRELVKYTDQGAYSWDAPGHMGGVAFLKHPVGMAFHQFFGENLMRSDLGISTAELGSWLDHVGPPAESERNAARIFGADWTFYVLGGSSTSNQIVGHGVIGQDEMVIADLNCHKSICHSLTVTGARPVYFKPTRNGYGMIGLVPLERFKPEQIRALIDKSPFAAGAVSRDPSYAVVTNSTYDGFCYNVDAVVEELSKSVPRVHFDEAWYAYAKFHSLYKGRFAMDVPDEMPDRPLIFATQSTHKMLAAFSMASMIHVKLSPRAPLEFDQFNESFMMHGTTSPFYPMIASIDVATAMMDEPAGSTLMEETIQDAITFRKAMASVAHRLKSEEGDWWFFGMFQPDYVTDKETGEIFRFEDAPDDLLGDNADCWTLKPGEDWHGFTDDAVQDDYVLLDPTKVTILLPGISPQGVMQDWGIPAAILTAFLDARRVEIARTGDYTILTLFSVGTSKGKWGSLLETLFEFKRLYDQEAMLNEALPALTAKYPDRYGSMTLKQLSDDMHNAMRELNLPGLLHAACDTEPNPVLTPAQTYQKLIRNGTERVKVAEMAGRIPAVMLVPYPPGIPIRMPGERLGGIDSPTIQLLMALEDFGRRFPGFEREVHGIEVDAQGQYWTRGVIETPHLNGNGKAKPRTRPATRATKKTNN
ncbi:Orn/Lys/Arg decarboxylase N-terminal domain-containing protein [Silvibacterium dinghuense]|uniref:Arginine decarboxylase n=1 Tax=Silvibacterium dinghuense TaxID=1560006 RepID=A0A4Q1SJB0_9BACT|nr:Orn/Lys/Arg decarboxylase N-terminal domain-containing protein [Silvibacterium dinghuense]RXS97724.1 arginine decarboxylase [Silvibacterium dinghuense]GGH01464.1 arginine decarboxylase [Silvibacterium dinghuense]